MTDPEHTSDSERGAEPRPDVAPAADPADPDRVAAPAADPAVPPAVTGAAGTAGADRFEITVAELTGDGIDQGRRRHLLARLVAQLRGRGVTELFKPAAAMRWLVQAVSDVAPYIPIRDRQTLRRHHPGLDDEELADRLIRNATRASAGIGAAGGGISAVQWAATPTLLSAPVLLAAETVAVVAVELKLVGELHQLYGVPVPGTGTERAINMIHSWANQRGVNPVVPGVGVGAVLGTAARRELGELLLRRFGRNLTTLGPFLTGAAVASYLNRRATRALADRVRADLRTQRRALELMHPPQPPAIGP